MIEYCSTAGPSWSCVPFTSLTHCFEQTSLGNMPTSNRQPQTTQALNQIAPQHCQSTSPQRNFSICIVQTKRDSMIETQMSPCPEQCSCWSCCQICTRLYYYCVSLKYLAWICLHRNQQIQQQTNPTNGLVPPIHLKPPKNTPTP